MVDLKAIIIVILVLFTIHLAVDGPRGASPAPSAVNGQDYDPQEWQYSRQAGW